MDIESVVNHLRQELSRIEDAISALVQLKPQAGRPRRGRPPKSHSAAAAIAPKRRTMSASARARISAAQKARWAKQRSAKSSSAKKSSGRRPMSAAARKKLSALMKARWAARQKS